MLTHIKPVFVALLVFLGVTACTPEEIAIWKSLSASQQHGVVNSISHSSTDCVGEMRKHWPAHLHGWAEGIMWRESRFNARAQNPSSTAAGCFQLLYSYHADKYPPHCKDRYNAHCNVQAAYRLYQIAGSSPWHL